jgi:hypothetical protein
MIVFNDIALESVAPGIKVEDVRVSPIPLSATARQRPAGFGADFVRMTGGSRTVAITFALLETNMTTRQDTLRAITGWARSDGPGRLQLPGHIGVHLDAICTQLPEPSLRQWWESKLRITFTTMENPYWTSDLIRSAACGTEIAVSGSAPPVMRIERTLASAALDQSYSDGIRTMTFSEIPAGKLVLDLNRQTAAVDGSSIMSAYSFDSSFIYPHIGRYTIAGTGTVVWSERWE